MKTRVWEPLPGGISTQEACPLSSGQYCLLTLAQGVGTLQEGQVIPKNEHPGVLGGLNIITQIQLNFCFSVFLNDKVSRLSSTPSLQQHPESLTLPFLLTLCRFS